MIDLHYWTTPNGHKITMFLEETGPEVQNFPVQIGKGEQFKPEFLAIAPNNRIPAMVDHKPKGGGKPISVFESGAMLVIWRRRPENSSRRSLRPLRRDPVDVLADGRARADGRAKPSLRNLRAGKDQIRHRPLCERDQPLYGVLNKRLADANSSPAITRSPTWRAIPGSCPTRTRTRTSTTFRI
jgi:GST-like protein